MAKKVDNSVLDASLSVDATANLMILTSAEPTDRANAIALALAQVAMTPGDGNDYTISDGLVSGRRVTMAQKVDVNVDVQGSITHCVLVDATTLLTTTTTPTTAVDVGNQVTINPWDRELEDPT